MSKTFCDYTLYMFVRVRFGKSAAEDEESTNDEFVNESVNDEPTNKPIADEPVNEHVVDESTNNEIVNDNKSITNINIEFTNKRDLVNLKHFVVILSLKK